MAGIQNSAAHILEKINALAVGGDDKQAEDGIIDIINNYNQTLSNPSCIELIYKAILKENINIINALIEQICRVNPENGAKTKNSALIFASGFTNKPEIVNAILDKGADIEFLNGNGFRPIIAAANSGRTAVISALLARGANINSKNENGETALIMAASRGHLGAVRELLDKGADINARDNKLIKDEATKENKIIGLTSLILAAKKGHLNIVKELLDRGADIKEKSIAYEQTALIEAAYEGHLNVVKELLARGADIESKDINVRTALSIAALSGNLDVVKELLDRGADKEAKDKYGRTALIYAALSGNLDVVKELLARGADINSKDGQKFTALHCAASKGHSELSMHLLTIEGQENLVKSVDNDFGYQLLGFAARGGAIGLMNHLLDNFKDIDINYRSEKNFQQTALQTAIGCNQFEAARLLIDRGADINIPDIDGEMAVDYTHTPRVEALKDKELRQGHRELAEFLISKGGKRKPEFTLVDIEPKVANIVDGASAEGVGTDKVLN